MTLPSVAVGAGLYADGLGADGIGPLAVRSAGYSPVIFFDGSSLWVTSIFIAATLVFAIGLLSLVNGSIQRELLRGWSRYVCLVSAIIFFGAPVILSGWAMYGVALEEFERVAPDVRIINLETNVTKSDDHAAGKGIHYRMHPENIPCLTVANMIIGFPWLSYK